VASRRTAANTTFDNSMSALLNNARYGGKDYGDAAAQAFREALGMARRNAERWGGLREVPRVDPTMQAARTSTIIHRPDGTVEVTVPQTPAAPAASSESAGPAQAEQSSAEDGPWLRHEPLTNTPAAPPPMLAPNPDSDQLPPEPQADDTSGQPDAYTGAVRPRWDPSAQIADLQAQGVPDDVIAEAMALDHPDYVHVAP